MSRVVGVGERAIREIPPHLNHKSVVFFDAYPHLLGGGQRATLLMAEGLAKRGWPVSVATTGEGPYPEAARSAGIAVTVLAWPDALSVYGRRTTGWRAVDAAGHLPSTWVKAARWLRKKADIVHVADHRGQLLIGPAARLAGCKVVWHIHAVNRSRPLTAIGSMLADRIVVPSRAMADTMPGLPRGSTSIVPYALPHVALAERAAAAMEDDLVVTVGRQHPDKGLDILLQALASVRDRRPAMRCVVAGPVQRGYEPYADELRALRRKLGLDDSVTFAGAVTSSRPLLERASVYVQSSREQTELQPIAVLEAMAAGVPVVSTAVGSVTEMLDDGRRGSVVPPEDPEDLARAVVDLLEDPSRRARQAKVARQYAVAQCNPDRMIDQLEEVYRSL